MPAPGSLKPALSSEIVRPRCAAALVEHGAQAPSEPVHLIEQMQDQGHALVVDAEIVFQLPNERRAGQVDLAEGPLRFALRDQPSRRDPGFNRLVPDARTNDQLVDGDHASLSKCWRGFSSCPPDQPRTKASSSGSGRCGSRTLRVTY